jgi:deoxyguanosine kinase
MNTIYLLLGSNIGDRLNSLAVARDQVSFYIGRVREASFIYETGSWGFEGEDFLNQCIAVNSALAPEAVMREITRIEHSMGRKRTGQEYENRTIDIDILFYNDEIVRTPGLIIPHRDLENRRFVLEPLHEIAPGLVHPVIKKEIRILLSECRDRSKAVKYETG